MQRAVEATMVQLAHHGHGQPGQLVQSSAWCGWTNFVNVHGAHFAAHHIVCCVHIGEQCEADLSALLAALDRDANGLPA